MKRLSLLIVLAGLVAAGPAEAVTFNVTTTEDEVDVGACFAGDPDCALREAIVAANSVGTEDVINVPAASSDYDLTIPPDGTNDDGLDGDLDILDDVTVVGAGAGAVTVDAGGVGGIDDRVLHAAPSGDPLEIAISGLTVTGGRADNGGGISAEGVVTVDSVVVTDNHALLGSTGGGMVNDGEHLLVVRNSVVSDNTAAQGGGVAGDGGGPVEIYDSRITGNRAEGDDNSYGGGVLEDGGNIVEIHRSEITGNTVEGYLGGGVAENGGGTGRDSVGVLIRDSLIANNHITDPADDSSFSFGGGVGEDGGARVEIFNSTISGNSVTGSSSSQLGHGGGVGEDGGAEIRLTNVTLADNTSDGPGSNAYTADDPITFKNTIVSGGGAQSCFAEAGLFLTSNGHNIDSGSSCGFGSTGDQSNTNPLLAALADNGGFTQTRALQEGSPAIDSADPAACPAADQRGVARPQLAGCDKGAFEFSPEAAPGQSPPPAEQPQGSTPAAQARPARPRVRVAGLRRACVSRRLRFRVRVTAGARLRSVRVLVDGRRVKTMRRSRFTVTINARRLRAGRHRLRIEARDSAGNRTVVNRRFAKCAQAPRRRAVPRFTG